MKIISTATKGNFKIMDESTEVSELVYASWFSGKASATIGEISFELKPKNIWASKIDIYKNSNIIGDITFNLKGHMVIQLSENNKEFSYIMKNNALWTLKFEVFDENEVLQFNLNSEGKWSKLKYDYQVEMDAFNNNIPLEELLIYCGYASNLYLALISAV
ncbi:aminotransferase [Joostella sp. CR20]|uniref:aminotransferase n=1 Tax=Joostella sp. CR20 TaxID=2804312 RepID=UPI00313B1C05